MKAALQRASWCFLRRELGAGALADTAWRDVAALLASCVMHFFRAEEWSSELYQLWERGLAGQVRRSSPKVMSSPKPRASCFSAGTFVVRNK